MAPFNYLVKYSQKAQKSFNKKDLPRQLHLIKLLKTQYANSGWTEVEFEDFYGKVLDNLASKKMLHTFEYLYGVMKHMHKTFPPKNSFKNVDLPSESWVADEVEKYRQFLMQS